MQTWARRGLPTALFTGGLLMLGPGIASADDDVDEAPDLTQALPVDGNQVEGVLVDVSGDVVDLDWARPVRITANATTAGDADADRASDGETTTHDAVVISSGHAGATADYSLPVQVFDAGASDSAAAEQTAQVPALGPDESDASSTTKSVADDTDDTDDDTADDTADVTGFLTGSLDDVPAAAVVQPPDEAAAADGSHPAASDDSGMPPVGAQALVYDVPVEVLARAITESAAAGRLPVGEEDTQLYVPVSGLSVTELPSLVPAVRSPRHDTAPPADDPGPLADGFHDELPTAELSLADLLAELLATHPIG